MGFLKVPWGSFPGFSSFSAKQEPPTRTPGDVCDVLANRQAGREAGESMPAAWTSRGLRASRRIRKSANRSDRRMKFRADALPAESQIVQRHRRQHRARRLEKRLERQPIAFVVRLVLLIANRRPDPDRAAGVRVRCTPSPCPEGCGTGYTRPLTSAARAAPAPRIRHGRIDRERLAAGHARDTSSA